MEQEEPAGEGISGPTEEVQTSASGHEYLDSLAVGVVDPFQDVLPMVVLVDFVEADPGRARVNDQRAIEEAVVAVPPPDRWNVPIEEKLIRVMAREERARQRRLTALTGAGNEPHLGSPSRILHH